MTNATVTGKSYGKLVSGNYERPGCTFREGRDTYVWLPCLDGREAEVDVYSQYGWEDGCRMRHQKKLINPKYVSGISGDACNLSRHKISCGEIVLGA